MDNFNIDEELIRYILLDADLKIINDEFVGNGHFLIRREYAGPITDILESLDIESRDIPLGRCESVFPQSVGDEFKPTQKITNGRDKAFVTDGYKTFCARYYWLFVEKMGFKIHGDEPRKPHALVKNGEIVGSCMAMNMNVLAEKIVA